MPQHMLDSSWRPSDSRKKRDLFPTNKEKQKMLSITDQPAGFVRLYTSSKKYYGIKTNCYIQCVVFWLLI